MLRREMRLHARTRDPPSRRGTLVVAGDERVQAGSSRARSNMVDEQGVDYRNGLEEEAHSVMNVDFHSEFELEVRSA